MRALSILVLVIAISGDFTSVGSILITPSTKQVCCCKGVCHCRHCCVHHGREASRLPRGICLVESDGCGPHRAVAMVPQLIAMLTPAPPRLTSPGPARHALTAFEAFPASLVWGPPNPPPRTA